MSAEQENELLHEGQHIIVLLDASGKIPNATTTQFSAFDAEVTSNPWTFNGEQLVSIQRDTQIKRFLPLKDRGFFQYRK